ncbi:dynein axonemal assembly factor 11 isoform X2 [Planococcus citri]|uniref:dynein axonemal assembly factor 11 isoform X2 n=1 Tax=Planococcus citri TaxID=170843 RepID=UPI0031FA3D3B
MTTITEDLVRRRAEHNDGQIGTLEELSLHQQQIIKIDHLQNWCKDLKILFLQSNVISRIENLNKLKKLEYLNLALNNIERIENLDMCESLQKLDLTLNFVGELTSVISLKNNRNLKELYLMGNPCCKYEKYREYVIAALPHLMVLDGIEISHSDRIIANRDRHENHFRIIEQQDEYGEKRKSEKRNMNISKEDNNVDYTDDTGFWNEMSDNTPETRLAMIQHCRKSKENVVDLGVSKPKREVKLFKKDGLPMNVNEAKIPFTLTEDEDRKNFILTVEVYKHLDTSLLDVDVQPWFVRVLIKGKVLQLVLPEEVHPDQSKAQRGISSKRLTITMPKEKEILNSASSKKY